MSYNRRVGNGVTTANHPKDSGPDSGEQQCSPEFYTSLSSVRTSFPRRDITEEELAAIDDELTLPTPPHDQCFDSIPIELERRGITSQKPATLWQGNLFQKETMWRDSIVTRLRGVGAEHLAQPLANCHQERSVRVCCRCKTPRIFWNRCELKHCPICAERLAKERRQTVEWWTRSIKQPKHVVLTARNTEDFSETYLRWFKEQFAKLRRRKLCSNWRGGFYSIEVTWKKEGAHVHLHALVDAKWIDAPTLAKVWGELMGQDFAIVKVKDARATDYLAEVTKYVAKGSEIATWPGEKMARFIEAIQDVRMFGVFGCLFKQRAQLRDFLKLLHSMRNVCSCGCRKFYVECADHWEALEEIRLSEHARPPPTAIRNLESAQLQLADVT